MSDTWAEKLTDYPSSAAILKQPRDELDEDYLEGVFCGYRYFDSFGIMPTHPFGFGLSYSTLEMHALAPRVERDCFVFPVRVTNTGRIF